MVINRNKTYNVKGISKSTLVSVPRYEGETIEKKVERIQHNGEAIKDGAPEIFTDRADGVISAYNIRTDRWEIACEAMDAVNKSKIASREAKVIDLKSKKEIDGGEAKESGA